MFSLNRREFGVLALSGSGLALGCSTDPPKSANLIVDCHAHIYAEDEEKYPTILEPKRPPNGTGTIEHLRREMEAGGVRYVTAIQTSSYYRWDNRFTTDSARIHREFMIAVVTLDPDDSSSPQLLEKYVNEYNTRGMRSVPAKSGRIDDPGVEKLWETAEKLGIVVNVLAGRKHREQIETLVRRHPDLRVVIDHCFDLRAGPSMKPTLEDLSALAEIPSVYAKLTFIPTGSAEPYPCRDMHDACYQVIETFQPERCIWGSNFPCELWCPAISYAEHLRIFTNELKLEESARRAILGETAAKLWFAHGK
jgi:predicted TIM-barrel fold metal-dependent hydrolase